MHLHILVWISFSVAQMIFDWHKDEQTTFFSFKCDNIKIVCLIFTLRVNVVVHILSPARLHPNKQLQIVHCVNVINILYFEFVFLMILWYTLFSAWCSTVSSILGAWLDQYSEDFWSPPNYDCLQQLLSYLHRHFTGSDLERRARNLLAHFHRRQQCEPDPDGMKAGQERDHRDSTVRQSA